MNLPLANATITADVPSPVHYYRAFGLGIVSDFQLIELEPCEPLQSIDLVIKLAAIAWPTVRNSPTDSHFSNDAQYLHWDTVGTFKISGVDTIEVDPASDTDPRLLSFPLLGPIMALVLHRRGLLVLHASAVRIGGNCAVFLGDKGAGKSTTAASLIERGHILVSDDVVGIDLSGADGPTVIPAFPQLKLTASSSAAVSLQNVVIGEQLHPAIEKRQHRIVEQFANGPVPLATIYTLERTGLTSIVPLSADAGLSSLLRFSYVSRFPRPAMGAAKLSHLSACAQLAKTPGVQRLEIAAGLHSLPALAAAIEADVGLARTA